MKYGSYNGKDRRGVYLFLPPYKVSHIALSNGKPYINIVIQSLVSSMYKYVNSKSVT